MIEFGLYILTDDYMNGTYPKHYPKNKLTGERPFFMVLKDEKKEDVYWMVPISSQDHKYEEIFKKYPNAGEFIVLHNNKRSAVLTQNIIPVKKKDIEREFTVNNIHYILKDKQKRKNILKKAKIVKTLLLKEKMKSSVDVINIYNSL
ncbi:MAG: hypothetical protein IJO78_01815 [Erysipelotrichaceae bacterium]|nr:hypothetical protein [Erysipelotrichaceae bacterium]